jgi:hypothetical protein
MLAQERNPVGAQDKNASHDSGHEEVEDQPSRAVAGPPMKAALPIAPLATYCNTEIKGFFSRMVYTNHDWMIRWSMKRVDPPITLKRRGE